MTITTAAVDDDVVVTRVTEEKMDQFFF